MIEAGSIIEALEARRAAGAGRDDLLREAVQAIEAADGRYDWVGVYLLDGETLVLHNYVGKATDHTRIPVGRGVCGTAVAEDRDLVVDDVTALDNYLACSLETASEIVVLIRSGEDGTVVGQLDLDSDRRAAFGESDHAQLKRVADWLGTLFRNGA